MAMLKLLIPTLLLGLTSVHLLDAAYSAQNCYVCENSCEHPGAGDLKACSDSDPNSNAAGQKFVDGAFGVTGTSQNMNQKLSDFSKNNLSLSAAATPTWENLTHWVCYVAKDKSRGCLVMGKGLCAGDKGWLTAIKELSDKLKSIADKAKNSIAAMFSGVSHSDLDDVKKSNISTWIAENYFQVLVNASNPKQFNLDTCCEGDKCNMASMTKQSTLMSFILLGVIFIVI